MMNTTEKQKEFTKRGSQLGWLSIISNIVLFLLKYYAGLVSGSVALIADAWHTLSDSLSSIVLVVGIRLSRKPPDEKHPYGHGRAEWIASMLIGVFLIFVAYEFIQQSIDKLKSHEVFSYGILAWVATIISIVWKEALAQLSFRASRRSGLKSLKADGWHHRTDALSSLIVLIGLFFGRLFWWVDGLLGILVSIMILVAAYEVLSETFSSMLGEKPDGKTVDAIRMMVKNRCLVNVHLHNIRIHEYGYHREMTAHIQLRPDMTLEKSHEIATNIENMIEEEMNIRADIHVEPNLKG